MLAVSVNRHDVFRWVTREFMVVEVSWIGVAMMTKSGVSVMSESWEKTDVHKLSSMTFFCVSGLGSTIHRGVLGYMFRICLASDPPISPQPTIPMLLKMDIRLREIGQGVESRLL